MDTDFLAVVPRLIEGGADGLDKVAAALRGRGIDVDAVYLIRLSYGEGGREWVLRVVSPSLDQRKVLFPAIDLKRSGALPAIDERVRLAPLRPEHPEASRIMDYARKHRLRPLEIEQAGLDGLYVDYALIGSSFPVAA